MQQINKNNYFYVLIRDTISSFNQNTRNNSLNQKLFFSDLHKTIKQKKQTCHCLTNGFGMVRTICNLFLTVYFDLKVWRISSLFFFSAKFLSFQKIKVQVFSLLNFKMTAVCLHF